MTGASCEDTHTFLCDVPHELGHGLTQCIPLSNQPGPLQNVFFRIPNLVRQVGHIPDRYLDLLEIASYVHCADRYVNRGDKESLYFSSWQRRLRYVIAVREYDFWSDDAVRNVLTQTLDFLTGDRHEFSFLPGRSTPKVHMFDGEALWPAEEGRLAVISFSGGLDSTAGALSTLANSTTNVLLASHVSSPSIRKTQTAIVEELKRRFPGRVFHILYHCNLKGTRSREETQRARSFLYVAIAAAIAKAYHLSTVHLFENGVTSVNLPPSGQYRNARASRTTHPKTIRGFSELLTLVEGKEFMVVNPFFWLTKTDVLRQLLSDGGFDLFASTVSCSRTFDKGVKHYQTHCGRCSQCIDRRFATAAAGLLEKENRGIYAYDFVTDDISPDPSWGREERSVLVDYIRLAKDLESATCEAFEDSWMEALIDVLDGLDMDEAEALVKLHDLFTRHSHQVIDGLTEFQREYRKAFLLRKPTPNSLVEIISTHEYLDPVERLAAERFARLARKAVLAAFRTHKPENEATVQDMLEALLQAHSQSLAREFPEVRFALSSARPDFSERTIYIEVKYVRRNATPSKISESMAADCTKYPLEAFILFLVYDPDGKIADTEAFATAFESKRRCLVSIIR